MSLMDVRRMVMGGCVVSAALAGAPALAQDGDADPVAPGSFAELPPGCVVMDDIILPIRALEDRATYQTNFWPNHVVPYEFDANVTALNQFRTLQAMAELEAVGNLRYVVRTTESDYLHIQSGSGNNSYVGRIGGGQVVNIVSWSYKFIIAHELMHALGCWHEQQRPDRNTYVTIRFDNCQPGTTGNFNTWPAAIPFGTYDFDSIMHYDACSFSICCPAGSTCACDLSCVTIEAKPAYADQQWLMGNRNHLSEGDAAWIAFAYGEWDCNGNGQADAQEIAAGTVHDCNGNNEPDSCEGIAPCVGDVNLSCSVDSADFNVMAGNFGSAVSPGTGGDLNGDGVVDSADFNLLAGDFGCVP